MMHSRRFVTTDPRAILLAATAARFSQRPSHLMGITAPRVALDVDQALHLRLLELERADQRARTGGPFGRLDATLAGQGPRFTEDGLRYQDPRALYREEMERRQGLVN